jgi:hypothetical protein
MLAATPPDILAVLVISVLSVVGSLMVFGYWASKDD